MMSKETRARLESQLAFAASKEWLVAQKPVIEALYAEALKHASAMMAALVEWKEKLTPIVKQQLEAAKARAIELSKEGAVKLQEAQAKLLEESKNLGKKLEPHVAVAKAHVERAVAPALQHVEPQIAAVREKMAPVLVPVGATLQEWGKLAAAQWAIFARQMEAPLAAFQLWMVQTMQCLCMPLMPITYEAAGQDYPPPAHAAPAKP